MKPLLSLFISMMAVTCQAQNVTKVTTLVVKPVYVTNELGQWTDTIGATNSVEVSLGEAARVSMTGTTAQFPRSSIWMDKDGFRFSLRNGDVVAGPAVFFCACGNSEAGILTLERWKVAKK